MIGTEAQSICKQKRFSWSYDVRQCRMGSLIRAAIPVFLGSDDSQYNGTGVCGSWTVPFVFNMEILEMCSSCRITVHEVIEGWRKTIHIRSVSLYPYTMLKRRSENALNQYIVGVRLIYKSSWSMIARRMKAGKNVYRFKMNMSMSIDQENTGLSATCNAGINWVFVHSDSDWLSFMDSDG